MKVSSPRILWSLSVIAAAGVLVYAFLPRPIAVDLAPVKRGPLRVTIDEEGKTRVRERYVVSAPLAGRLLRVEVHAGDSVVAGKTLLAVIEPSEPELLNVRTRAQAEAQVKAAEAARAQAIPNLERARAGHDLATIELQRARQLFESEALPKQDLDVATHRERAAAEDFRSAQFAVRIAEFELEQARATLLRTRPRNTEPAETSHLEIRAPIGGRVLRLFQESETVLAPGTALLDLGDPSDLEVEVDVLSSDAVRIASGARVLLERWGGDQPLEGRVRLVEPAAFTKVSALGVEEQRVHVLITIEDPPERHESLGEGYRVEARIVLWEGSSVLKVSTGALFRHRDGWAVFRVVRNRAIFSPLTIGRLNESEAEVLGGGAENDEVILHPGDKLSDGVAVTRRMSFANDAER